MNMLFKKTNRRRKIVKKLPNGVWVTITQISAEETLFPEKLAKANEMLSKSDFDPNNLPKE